MTIREFWQAVFIAVIAKQGVSWDGALAAADKAAEEYTVRAAKFLPEEPK